MKLKVILLFFLLPSICLASRHKVELDLKNEEVVNDLESIMTATNIVAICDTKAFARISGHTYVRYGNRFIERGKKQSYKPSVALKIDDINDVEIKLLPSNLLGLKSEGGTIDIVDDEYEISRKLLSSKFRVKVVKSYTKEISKEIFTIHDLIVSVESVGLIKFAVIPVTNYVFFQVLLREERSNED